MRVLLAQPRGCCAGVDMAIDTLSRAIELYPAPIYCFHQIAHNRELIARFEQAGVIFVNDLQIVPEGATTVFSAHGVAPAVQEEAVRRKLRIIDATCPLVTKVHLEARMFAALGFTIVLIGYAGHDEIMGVMGEAPGNTVLVEKLADIERLNIRDPHRVAYLTQTTLSEDDARSMITALQARFPDIAGPPKEDICYATQNRQEVMRALSPRADMALIVGSANSSNSQRLAEVARHCGIPAYLIDGPENVDLSWFEGVSTLLLTAGASVPEYLFARTVDWLRQSFSAVVEEHPGKQELVRFQLPSAVRT
jgi:4-hydroxy-3-methylbut-2-enyl diphosphate reductase